MFTEFSKNMYRLLSARDYRPVELDTEDKAVSDAACWSVWKRENASICFVRVADCGRCDPAALREGHKAFMLWAENLLQDYRSVQVLYILASETASTPIAGTADGSANLLTEWLSEAEEYFEQPVYAVFWRLYLATGQIVTQPGQPSELFGLRAFIKEAVKPSDESTPADDNAPATFKEIREKTWETSPFRPSGRFPLWTAAMVVINVVMLLLIYLDGYPEDAMAPARFGAIVPERVFAGEYYRLFAAMFVHFGLMHLLMNVIGLVIFGVRVERFFGPLRFMVLYIFSGLCGSVFSLFFTRSYAAGASTCVFGLVGAAFAYTLVSKRAMDTLTDYLMLIYIVAGLAIGLLMPGIDNFGHLGGLLAGLFLGYVIMKAKSRAR